MRSHRRRDERAGAAGEALATCAAGDVCAGIPMVPSPFRSCWKLVSSDSSVVLLPDVVASDDWS